MDYIRAARKPTTLLSRKLHDEIGFALRKYMKATGARNGSVQLKTTSFLVSLHEDLVNERRSNPAWQTCLNESHVLSLAVAPPPGLDMQQVRLRQP